MMPPKRDTSCGKEPKATAQRSDSEKTRRSVSRRSIPREEEGPAQWLTLFNTVMIILLVFFMILISYASQERRNVAYARNAVATGSLSQDAAREALEHYTAVSTSAKDVAYTPISEGGFRAVVQTPVLFDTGKADIQRSAWPLLLQIAEVARKSTFFVTVEGHTDNTPIATAEFPSNWELSTFRAVNVLRFLANQGGIPVDRLSAVGYGEYRPVGDNATEEGRARNRRIEIVFTRDIYEDKGPRR